MGVADVLAPDADDVASDADVLASYLSHGSSPFMNVHHLWVYVDHL